MEKPEGEPKAKRNLLALKVVGVVLAVLVLSFVGAFVSYAKEYKNKVLPNVMVYNQTVSGKSRDELAQVIKAMHEEQGKGSIKLVSGDKSWETKFSDLDWQLDETKMTEKAFAYGHGDSSLSNASVLVYAGVKKLVIDPIFTFNENQASDWVLSINSEIGSPKQEANIQVRNKKAKVSDPSSGKEIDQVKIKKDIYDQLALKQKGDIKIELVESQPIISEQEAEGLVDKATELTQSPLELVGPKSSASWSSNTLGTLIEVKKKQEKGSFLQAPTYSPAYVSFNEDKISSMLEDSTQDLNIDPVEAKFTVANSEVTIQSPSQDGHVIDIPAAKGKILEILEAGKDKQITLPVKVQEASIKAKTPADIAKYGIKELIGSGSTSFAGSSPNRIHNIKTGVQAVSGALIKPGAEFSTTGQLGLIDGSTGYLQEMVIKEDKTVPEFGGGLCQVSTTLFRAALHSGLKITERHNHAYRVSYYEPPVGMDATIYSPSPDLKFLNDTPSYVLVQGRVEGNTATFDFYGTKDGRQVEISEPYVYDVVPPPDPIYTDDPSLAPGEEKRIDRAHPGAKASFTYKVKKEDKLIIDQKFNSTYVPWAAKYLRGPAQEGSDQAPQ